MDIVILGIIIAASAFLVLGGGALIASALVNRGAKTNAAWHLMGAGLILAGLSVSAFQLVGMELMLIAAAAGALGSLLVLIGAFLLRGWMKKLTS